MYVRIMGTLPYGILFLAASASAASTIDIIVILAAHIHKKKDGVNIRGNFFESKYYH